MKNIILTNLMKTGLSWRFKALCDCVRHNCNDFEVIEAIRALKSDERMIGGRKICEYAKAVLHILEAEKYEGDNEDVLLLINENMGVPKAN